MDKAFRNEYVIPAIGDVVAIGKGWIATSDINRLEKVHYLIYNEEGPLGEDGFAGVCLEYGLFSWGASFKDAENDLGEMSKSYVESLMRTAEGRQQIYEELGDGSLEGFWSLYRQLTFLLGDSEEAVMGELTRKEAELREAHEKINMLKVDMDMLKNKYAERVGTTSEQ